jgi:XTP/dITP diphosphohydrolase
MMKFVLASGNPGKVREIAEIFADLSVEVVPQSEFAIESPPETGKTFVENALLKARFAASISGLPALADDSGIMVDALDGRPGVYSARYAGDGASDEQNVDKLLHELDTVAKADRGAGFHCAAVLVWPQKETLISEAVWRGRILTSRQGAGGFGYDPVFFDATMDKTGAQMSLKEKTSVSHRGNAFRQLKDLIRNAYDLTR